MLDIFLGYCRNAYKSVTSWCKKINTFAFLQHLDGVSSWDLRCWLSGFKLAAALKLKNYWMLPIGFRLHWKWKELIDTCNISTTNSILLYSYHIHTYIYISIYVYIHISSYIIIYIYIIDTGQQNLKKSQEHTHTHNDHTLTQNVVLLTPGILWTYTHAAAHCSRLLSTYAHRIFSKSKHVKESQ